MKNELVTTEMIMEKQPCVEWTTERVQKILGRGKTLLQILKLKKVPRQDRIWTVTRFLPDIANRKFAIWCAKQCKTDIPEITACIDAIEAYYILGTGTEEQMRAAYWATDRAAYRAIYWAIYWATDRAAYRAAYRAADSAAYRAAERERQIIELTRLIKEAHDEHK